MCLQCAVHAGIRVHSHLQVACTALADGAGCVHAGEGQDPPWHSLSVLTWAMWKEIIPQLLTMCDYLVLAFVWDALSIKMTLRLLALTHCLDAIKAWHQLLHST